MSVVSKNIFDLLGDDGDDSPSPAPAPAKKAAAPAPAAPARAVPGAAPRGGSGGQRGRGSYSNRGAGGAGARQPREPRDAGFIATEGNVEGTESAGGFDGERVPPSRKGNHTRDAHTKGPRGTRPIRGGAGGGDRSATSGGHSSYGAGHYRGNKVPSGAGERGRFERKNLNGGNDSQKKVEHGWGANTGEAELKDEVEGEKDAQVEENQPQTPAPEGEAAEEETAAPEAAAAPVEPEEPEEVTKSYDEYLAERAQQQISGLGKKQAREVSSELEGQQFVREGIDEFFSGKAKTAEAAKTKAKKEKVFIEFDGQFARPPREGGDRRERGDRPERGERSERGERGGRGGRGRGARGGFGGERGTGAPRGGRGGPRGGRAPAGINANDTNAFPALGA